MDFPVLGNFLALLEQHWERKKREKLNYRYNRDTLKICSQPTNQHSLQEGSEDLLISVLSSFVTGYSGLNLESFYFASQPVVGWLVGLLQLIHTLMAQGYWEHELPESKYIK